MSREVGEFSAKHKPHVPPSVFLDKIRECMTYNYRTGALTWKISYAYNVRVGDPVGSINKVTGYVQTVLTVGTVRLAMKIHHIVWFLCKGVWPEHMLDHKDEDKINNRIGNLRYATNSGNRHNIVAASITNHSTGVKGVSFIQKRNKFRPHITVAGKQLYLRSCSSLEEAIKVRRAAEKRYCKEFAPNRRTV